MVDGSKKGSCAGLGPLLELSDASNVRRKMALNLKLKRNSRASSGQKKHIPLVSHLPQVRLRGNIREAKRGLFNNFAPQAKRSHHWPVCRFALTGWDTPGKVCQGKFVRESLSGIVQPIHHVIVILCSYLLNFSSGQDNMGIMTQFTEAISHLRKPNRAT